MSEPQCPDPSWYLIAGAAGAVFGLATIKWLIRPILDRLDERLYRLVFGEHK